MKKYVPKPKKANPRSTGLAVSHDGRTRAYFLEQKDGTHKPILLKYHVWTEEGLPKDAYELVGTTKVLSYDQVQLAIEKGILIPQSDPAPSLMQDMHRLLEAA